MNSLQRELVKYSKLAVAFSGGIDSMVLLAEAAALPDLQVLALLAVGPTFPGAEQEDAVIFCRQRGIEWREVAFNPLDIPEFRLNNLQRCYYCKLGMLRALQQVAEAKGAVLVEGTNVDDDGDYRPGQQALKELGIVSPLHQAGWGKKDIRRRAGELGLPADKPSMACLVSRVAYGMTLNLGDLKRIDQAEQQLRALGFRQVRLRLAGLNEYVAELDNGLEGCEFKLAVAVEEIVRSIFSRIEKLQIRPYRPGGSFNRL